MSLPHGETVTRLRGTAVLDPYSGEMTGLSWTTPDELPIDGWAVEFVSATEALAGQLSIDVRLYGPYEPDIKPLDRVVVRDKTYSVEGAPADWRNPYTGNAPGSVVEVRRVAG